jgi:rare lipoprotein A (peptidoglycan hydrolase)
MLIFFHALTGLASWFIPSDFTPAIRTSSPYVCAMNIDPATYRAPLKYGYEVEIENLDNGRTSHCTVTGSGPCCGRIIDASPRVRDDLGFTGIARVRVYRILGRLTTCHLEPATGMCKSPPPTFCVIDLPKSALFKCK